MKFNSFDELGSYLEHLHPPKGLIGLSNTPTLSPLPDKIKVESNHNTKPQMIHHTIDESVIKSLGHHISRIPIQNKTRSGILKILGDK